MRNEPIRVLHTGDWCLHEPCNGIARFPDALGMRLASAPQQSVTRAIDFAISEAVDVIVVGGNTLNPYSAAPADYDFLQLQLNRLHLADIPVIWNWSHLDQRQHWPRCFDWPENVTPIIGESPQVITIATKSGKDLTFIGSEITSDKQVSLDWFEGLLQDGPTLGVSYGRVSDDMGNSTVENWLFSGEPYGSIVLGEALQVHYSGSPQGRSEKATGPHGVALVEVFEDGSVESQFINTSKVEYEQLIIPGADVFTTERLAEVLIHAVEQRSFDPSVIYNIQVILSEASLFLQALPHLNEHELLHETIQSLFTDLADNLIFIGIHPEAAQNSVNATEKEILGEYLFVLEEMKEKGWAELNLQTLLAPGMDTSWCTIQEDLSGLRVLHAAESLGGYLFGTRGKEAA